MKFVLEPVSGPDIEPVTVDEMKVHLGEYTTQTDRDDEIEALITSAREWVEDFTGRVLIEQAWRLTVGPDVFVPADSTTGEIADGADGIHLRRSPALAITSVATVGSDGEETEVDAADYQLREGDSKWPRVVLLNGGSWSTGTTRIEFRAGFADRTVSPQQDATAVPARFKQAMKLHVEAHYDRDMAMMEKLLKAAENLIRPERCHVGLA